MKDFCLHLMLNWHSIVHVIHNLIGLLKNIHLTCKSIDKMGSFHPCVSAPKTIFPNLAQICGLILQVTTHLLSLCNKIIKLFLLPFSCIFFRVILFIKSHLMFLFYYLLYFIFCIFSALLSCFPLNFPPFILLLWWLLKEVPP